MERIARALVYGSDHEQSKSIAAELILEKMTGLKDSGVCTIHRDV